MGLRILFLTAELFILTVIIALRIQPYLKISLMMWLIWPLIIGWYGG
jgi:uncharacterized membrane protein